MKKIKTNNKRQPKTPMNVTSKVLIYGLAGVVLLAIFILIVFESTAGRITAHNKSIRKLEYIEAYFVDMEGPVAEEVMLFENFESGEKSSIKINKIDLRNRQANLEVRFKFDGYDDELFVDAGYFNDEFEGNISVSFSDTEDDKVLLKVKASTGILPSPQIDCNEEHIVNLEEGYVEE